MTPGSVHGMSRFSGPSTGSQGATRGRTKIKWLVVQDVGLKIWVLGSRVVGVQFCGLRFRVSGSVLGPKLTKTRA